MLNAYRRRLLIFSIANAARQLDRRYPVPETDIPPI